MAPKPPRRMPMPGVRARENAQIEVLRQQKRHLAQLLAAMLYDRCEREDVLPEVGFTFREQDLLRIEPGEIEIALERDDKDPSKAKVHLRMVAEVGPAGSERLQPAAAASTV